MNSFGAFVLLFIIMQVGIGEELQFKVELMDFDLVTRLHSWWAKSELLDYKVSWCVKRNINRSERIRLTA